MTLKKLLYSPTEMEDAVDRMAGAIQAEFPDGNLALVGLYMQGVPLSERLAAALEKRTGRKPDLARLDISLYRDDFGQRSALPLIRETVIPFDISDANIVLVDDVLSTGRTIRAALDAVTDYGRPRLIRLAVLANRGCPEYPIRADYVGFSLFSIPENHKVVVHFNEDPEETGVFEMEWNR